jgi:uncharacterized protein
VLFRSDRRAWEIVQEEANKSEGISSDDLTRIDLYIATGRRLAQRLAAHYHPLSNDPFEHVAVVEMLVSLELAADDLCHLCRQVPGGDLITPAHWKRAVQAAEYINWASDLYTYLLPIFQPLTGLVRLGTQRFMVKPAWRTMQNNVLRWFYEAFLNRLGTHLIELYSGRLVIGVDQYRKLARRNPRVTVDGELDRPELVIAVAGARDSGKTRVIAALEQARAGDMAVLKARLEGLGLDAALSEKLRRARLVEVRGYTWHTGGENARDRSTRRAAVEAAAAADLVILVIDSRREDHTPDIRFAQAWDRWYLEHTVLEMPPAMAVVSGVDRPALGGVWQPPHDWSRGQSEREAAVRARLEALRNALPPTVNEVVAVGLGTEAPYGTDELVLPALAALLHRAERVSLIRFLHRTSTRSKARRLIGQVGRLWANLKPGRAAGRQGAGPEQ